jgi:hypothetical protein
MALTRIDSYLVDLDSLGGITFDDQAGTPTFKVDAVNHRVGVGTSNPAKPFHATGEVQFSINTKTHVTHLFTTGSANDGIYLIKDASNIDRVLLHSNGSSYLNGGNVGIGVNTPASKLHVDGSINQTWSNWRLGIFYDDSYRQGLAYGASDRTLKIFSTTNDSGGNVAIYTRVGLGASDSDYGIERLRVTAAGNVGIGTTNPQALLHLVTAGAQVRWDNTAANDARHEYYRAGVRQAYINWDANNFNFAATQSGGVITFATGGTTEKVRIASDGNVGIGITDPLALLHVYGNVNPRARIQSLTSSAAGLDLVNTAGGATSYLDPSANLRFYLGSDRVTFTQGGNVGIGTTNPNEKLQITAGNVSIRSSTGQWGSLRFGITNSLYLDAWAGIESDWEGVGLDVSNLKFFTSFGTRSEKMRISALGNVGIGITNPVSGLSVTKSGTLFFADSVWMQPSGNTLITARGASGQDNWMGIGGHYYATSGSANLLLQANFGDLGSVVGHYISSTATGIGSSYFSIGRMIAGGGIGIPAAKQPQLNIDVSGNVGIGTTNPEQKLHVQGSIRAQVTGGGTGILLHSNTGWSAASNLAQFWTGQTNGFAFYANDTGNGTNELVRVSATGNVGIGTTNPTSKLYVFSPDSTNTAAYFRITNSSVGSGTYRNIHIDGTHPNGASLWKGVDITPSQAINAPMTGIDMSWNQTYAEARGVNINIIKNTHSGGGNGIGVYSRVSSSGVDDRAFQATAGWFITDKETGALDPFTSYPVRIENKSTTGDTNLLGLYTDSSTQRLRVYYDRTNKAIRYHTLQADDSQRFYNPGSAVVDNVSYYFETAGRLENIGGRQYGIRIDQGGARYTNQTALYATHTNTVGNFAGNYRGVHGVTSFETQAGGTTEAIFGETTIPNWNYQSRHCAVRGIAVGGGTTFSATYGLSPNNGAFGGHFVAYGKADCVGVYADAYHLAGSGAGTQAVPLIVASNGSELMRVNSVGNVGIGTTNPISKLYVEGTFRTALSSGAGGDTLLSAIVGVSNGYIISVDNSNNITYKWHTGNNTQAMTINSSGNVGIGTTNPVAKLDVYGGGISCHGWSNTNSGPNGGLELGFDGTQVVLQSYDRVASVYKPILYSGSKHQFTSHVGIGTTNPLSTLHVVGTDGQIYQQATRGAGRTWRFGTSGTNAENFELLDVTGGQRAFLYGSATGGYSGWELLYNGNVGIKLNGSGNVGIGTTNPTSTLHVQGQITVAGGNRTLYGPNPTWGAYLAVGGDGNQANTNVASVVTTNGNLHLDSGEGSRAVYLNWYGGNSGTYFGNGDGSTTIARVDGNGNAVFAGSMYANSISPGSAYSIRSAAMTSQGNVTFSWTFSTNGDSTYLVTAAGSHYGLSAYQCMRQSYMCTGPNSSETNLHNYATTTHGNWTFTWASNTLTVTHNAGTYNGQSSFWVTVEGA